MTFTAPSPRGRSPGGRARPALSAQSIVEEALALIDSRGVGAATTRAIGGRLHVRAMALYKHFPTRDAILDAVVDRIVHELNDDPQVPPTAEAGWRDYLTRLAHGVRRYAVAHPHAFPLVTTRPVDAPWVNPPLRSLSWIESMLSALADAGFDDAQVLYAYRSFNSFLLGYLLLETGARTLNDPQPGDGTFDPADPAADPVPGGLQPGRSAAEEQAVDDAATPLQLLDPQDGIDTERHPTIHRLAPGLAEDHYTEEFDWALADMLDRIETRLGPGPNIDATAAMARQARGTQK